MNNNTKRRLKLLRKEQPYLFKYVPNRRKHGKVACLTYGKQLIK